jgi:hypothetical protein
MVDCFLGQFARAPALVWLPMLGEVADNHVAHKHRLHGFAEAFGRHGLHHTPG